MWYYHQHHTPEQIAQIQAALLEYENSRIEDELQNYETALGFGMDIQMDISFSK